MLALLWLAYASFGMVSSSLAPLVGQVTGDLGLSYSHMGTILGVWQLTYIGVWAASRGFEPRRMADSAHQTMVPFQAFPTAGTRVGVAAIRGQSALSRTVCGPDRGTA